MSPSLTSSLYHRVSPEFFCFFCFVFFLARFLRGVPTILFLNKMDRLRDKLALAGARDRLKAVFPDYNGEHHHSQLH
jgi:hypothetical protein